MLGGPQLFGVSTPADLLVPEVSATPTELTDTYVYPYLYELRLRNPGCPVFVNDRPFVRMELAEWLVDCFSADSLSDARSRWLHEMLKHDLSGEIGLMQAAAAGWTWDTALGSMAANDARVMADGFTRFSVYVPGGLSLWSSIRVTLNDPEGHKTYAKVWKDRGRASMEHGGIGYRRKWFSIFFGRDEIAWGAARDRGLLFSGSAPSYDMLKLRFGDGRFRYTSFHTMLRRDREEDPLEKEHLRRYVSAHRLDICACRSLTFSLTEAVIYGGDMRNFEPVYLNPAGLLYAEQWNSHSDDNILIAGDFSFLVPGRVEIRGELMVDDFQYDFGDEPHKLAAGLGIAGLNPLQPARSMIGGSYYHIRGGTYNHHVIWNRFVQEGHIMGYPDGPDGDRLSLWISLALPDPLYWSLDYSYRRQGEGSVTDEQLPDSPQVKFPSGIVEKEHRFGLELSWRPAFAWIVEGSVVYHSTDNMGNMEARSDSGFDFGLGLTFNYKTAGRFGD
jgi:hypothetical protein